MYAGRKVEEADTATLFANPLHPYTRGLMNSVPGRRVAGKQPRVRARLQEITGMVPSLREEIVGCPFAPRCSFAQDRCSQQAPALEDHGNGHLVSCWEAVRVGETPR